MSVALLGFALTVGPLMLLGASQDDAVSVVAVALIILFWGIVVAGLVGPLTARAVADASGLTYRSGLVRHTWVRSQIGDITTAERSGFGYGRLCLEVVDSAGKSRALWALQCPARSAAGVTQTQRARRELATILGVAQGTGRH
jgi:hypothetical protein